MTIDSTLLTDTTDDFAGIEPHPEVLDLFGRVDSARERTLSVLPPFHISPIANAPHKSNRVVDPLLRRVTQSVVDAQSRLNKGRATETNTPLEQMPGLKHLLHPANDSCGIDEDVERESNVQPLPNRIQRAVWTYERELTATQEDRIQLRDALRVLARRVELSSESKRLTQHELDRADDADLVQQHGLNLVRQFDVDVDND